MKKNLNPEWFYDELINQRTKLFQSLENGSTKDGARKDLEYLSKLHPFIIGPATIESLINEKMEGVFGGSFELDQTYKSLMGIRFLINMQEDKIYYDDNTNPKHVAMQALRLIKKGISSGAKDPRSFLETAFQGEDTKNRKIMFPKESKINDFPNGDTFYKIPNLCINLINYINSHNITIVKRERDIVFLEKIKKGKQKKRKQKSPFYLIPIKDEIYIEPDTRKEIGKWELTERIHVRGHDRKYRDNRGDIKKIIWIPPHVKGPESAPWRNQRYEILAGKLKREKEMASFYLNTYP